MGGDSTRGREPWKKAQEGQDVIVTSLRLQGEDTEAELRRIETSSVDVVLVHGLTGDPHETWGAKKKGS